MPIGQVLKPPVYASRPYLVAMVILAAETLFPGYFALVMATAAVSIASFLLG
jgi:membrane protein implicated in regulation of membrane protease activity